METVYTGRLVDEIHNVIFREDWMRLPVREGVRRSHCEELRK